MWCYIAIIFLWFVGGALATGIAIKEGPVKKKVIFAIYLVWPFSAAWGFLLGVFRLLRAAARKPQPTGDDKHEQNRTHH